VRLISQRLKWKASEKREGKRVRVPGIEEFVVVDDSGSQMQKVLASKRGRGLRLPQLALV